SVALAPLGGRRAAGGRRDLAVRLRAGRGSEHGDLDTQRPLRFGDVEDDRERRLAVRTRLDRVLARIDGRRRSERGTVDRMAIEAYLGGDVARDDGELDESRL